MTKRLTGSKRLAVIQRWINGHDDPDWEVLPTRREGKYIVKRRDEPLEEHYETPEEPEEVEESQDYEEKPPKPRFPRVKPPKLPKPPKIPETQDPTVNLEILNQLKLLGEEIKTKREKKEQKRLIQEAIEKQRYKSHAYYPQEYMYQQPPQQEYMYQQSPPQQVPQEQPQQYSQPVMFQRRNRIFDDYQ